MMTDCLEIKKWALAFVFIILIIASSCSNKGNFFMSGKAPLHVRVKPDAETVLLPYQTITNDTLYVAESLFAKIDSFLIFRVNEAAGYSFMVFNENTGNVVLGFPKIGRGPGEQILSKLTQVRRNNGTVEIDCLGLSEHSILAVDLYRSIQQQKTVVVNQIDLPQNTMYAYSFGESLAGIVLFDEYDYSLQVFNARTMERERLFLPFGLEVDPGNVTSVSVMKEDGTKCLWAMSWMDKFNILDLEDEAKSVSYTTSRKTVSDRQLFATITEMPIDSVKDYYCSARAVGDNVYMLYKGSSIEERNQRNLPREIQNFDWDGHFKNRYIVNEKFGSFVVSEDGSTLYGYSSNESKVYVYSLK